MRTFIRFMRGVRQVCGETRGLDSLISYSGCVRLAPPQPMPRWCSRCAHPPEERKVAVELGGAAPIFFCGRSSVVEPESSKLRVVGSIPTVRSIPPFQGSSAVERRPVKALVVGSIPTLGANIGELWLASGSPKPGCAGSIPAAGARLRSRGGKYRARLQSGNMPDRTGRDLHLLARTGPLVADLDVKK